MKKYVILYYKHDDDELASQAIVEAENSIQAIVSWHIKEQHEIDPITVYNMAIRKVYNANPIPYPLQKDI